MSDGNDEVELTESVNENNNINNDDLKPSHDGKYPNLRF